MLYPIYCRVNGSQVQLQDIIVYYTYSKGTIVMTVV